MHTSRNETTWTGGAWRGFGCVMIAATSATAVYAGCGGSTAGDVVAASDASVDSTSLADTAPASLPDGAVLDGGTSSDAGPGGNAAGLPCGTVSCPTVGAVCCIYPISGGGASYLCVGGATCPVGDASAGGGGQTPTVINCSATANCAAGTVCCVGENTNNQGEQSYSSHCKPTCGAREAQLCDPAATASGCPASAPCSSANIATWELPSTYATCGGVRAQ